MSTEKATVDKEAVNKVLAGMSVPEMHRVAKTFLGEDFRKSYGHMNHGMQRMCLGNRIRGNLSRGGKITKLRAAVKEVKASRKAK